VKFNASQEENKLFVDIHKVMNINKQRVTHIKQ